MISKMELENTWLMVKISLMKLFLGFDWQNVEKEKIGKTVRTINLSIIVDSVYYFGGPYSPWKQNAQLLIIIWFNTDSQTWHSSLKLHEVYYIYHCLHFASLSYEFYFWDRFTPNLFWVFEEYHEVSSNLKIYLEMWNSCRVMQV